MFAVIKTGGKQYRVAPDDVVKIEKLEGEVGDAVAFESVLMLSGDSVTLGTPTVEGASVAGEIVEHARGPKTISFKKRRRQNSKRKKGHRQHITVVRITDILLGGKKSAKPTKVKAETSSAKHDAAADEATSAA